MNWESLPINRPVCPVLNHNRDGQHRQTITKSTVNYHPNRFGSVTPATPSEGALYEYPEKLVGFKQRSRAPKFQEHYNQATLYYNSLKLHEKAHLINAISFELDHCDDPQVYENAIPRLNEIDHELAKAVANKVGGPAPSKPTKENHGKTSKGISQTDFLPEKPTIKSRRIAILVADGFDATVVQGLRAAIKAGGALSFVIGPRRGQIKSASNTTVQADHHYEGQRSTMFDAVFIPPGAKSVGTMSQDGRVVHWVRETFGHCKAIGAIGEGIALLRDAALIPGVELASVSSGSDDVKVSYGVVTAASYSASSAASDVLKMGPEEKGFVSQFAYEISKHRCWEREMDGLTAKVAF